MFESFKDTWLYEAPVWLIAEFGWLLFVLVGLVGVVVAGGYSFFHIAKGGGQYGIIEGYVGTIGAGKTTLAVQHALLLAKARSAVLLSNIPVFCQGTVTQRAWQVAPGIPLLRNIRVGPVRTKQGCLGNEQPRDTRYCVIEHDTLPMNDVGLDLGELTRRAFRLRDENRGLVLLMDEVGVIMPARLWKDFPVGLMWILQQSRKLACEWIWTAQDVSFVEHQLRTLTAVVHYVKAYPPPSIWRRVQGKRPWVLIASAFTPLSAPRANDEGGRREKRMGRRVARYQRAWEASFDTDGVVLPSIHLKGSAVLIDAVRGDRHAIASQSSNWGESPEPEVSATAERLTPESAQTRSTARLEAAAARRRRVPPGMVETPSGLMEGSEVGNGV